MGVAGGAVGGKVLRFWPWMNSGGGDASLRLQTTAQRVIQGCQGQAQTNLAGETTLPLEHNIGFQVHFVEQAHASGLVIDVGIPLDRSRGR